MSEIDLEVLAAGYRHRPSSRAARDRADREAGAAGLEAGRVAIDVGGGRGDHAARFARTGATVVLVDRSEEMARAGTDQPGVAAIVGDSARLPLRSGVASLVYVHVSIHYGDWRAVLAEAARTLRPGGLLAVWTFAGEHFADSFLARWFPSVPAIDRSRFPDPGRLAHELRRLGFAEVEIGAETETVRRRAGSWCEAVENRFVSTLQMLPPGELEAGLGRFRRSHPDPDEVIEYTLDYRRIAGRAPRRESAE